ncbi:MAG: hypothetical protein ACHQ1H_14780 [Nitrososphaerales archaeon]
MVRTWVSGNQNTAVVDKLRQEISDLEVKRDLLMDSRKAMLFQWASNTLKSGNRVNDKLSSEISEIIAEYDSITQTIFDREVLLTERLEEQAKFDSLG